MFDKSKVKRDVNIQEVAGQNSQRHGDFGFCSAKFCENEAHEFVELENDYMLFLCHFHGQEFTRARLRYLQQNVKFPMGDVMPS